MAPDASAILATGMWIAGKPGSSSFKVHLAGEPQPLAIKADVQMGWVEVLTPARDNIAKDGLGAPCTRVLKGVVTLVATNE